MASPRSRLLHGLWPAWLAAALPATAAGQLLSPMQAVERLADGRPWQGTPQDGEPVWITFNPDGTGRFEGPFALRMRWAIRGQDICLDMGIIVKCLRFRDQGPTLEAFEHGAQAFTLSRPAQH